MYYVSSLGYDLPPEFKTLKDARKFIRECILEDKERSHQKLSVIKHDNYLWELRIGSRQGYNIYSTYRIIKEIWVR